MLSLLNQVGWICHQYLPQDWIMRITISLLPQCQTRFSGKVSNIKPYKLGIWNLYWMFTYPRMSCVICHIVFIMSQNLELINVWSFINGPTLSSLNTNLLKDYAINSKLNSWRETGERWEAICGWWRGEGQHRFLADLGQTTDTQNDEHTNF